MPLPSEAHTPTAEPPSERASRPSDYLALTRLLFHKPAAVAIIGSDPGTANSAPSSSTVAEDIAEELGAAGHRVVVVSVNRLLSMDLTRLDPKRISEETESIDAGSSHVWSWPAPAGARSHLYLAAESSVHGLRPTDSPTNWLDFLRLNFHAVLLDCPYVEGAPGVTEVAAMADAVLLAVQTGYTSKAQVQHNLQALQLWGARVVGSILIERSESNAIS